MSSSGKLLELVQKAASAVTMTSSSDLSEMENLQGLLSDISACVEQVGQMPDELRQQAKDATDSASNVISSLLTEEIKDSEQSIKTVSDTIVNLQSLAEQISQTVTDQADGAKAPQESSVEQQIDETPDSQMAESEQTGVAAEDNQTESAVQDSKSEPESEDSNEDEFEEHVIDEDDLPLVMDFIAEAAEHIENAEAGLLEVESKPDDADSINLIFRGFHTVKGMAGFLNLVNIGSLAHAAENLLDLGRKGEIRFEGENMNVIFESVDMLKVMMEQLQEAVNGDCALKPVEGLGRLLTKLKACAEGNAQAAAEPESSQSRESTSGNEQVQAQAAESSSGSDTDQRQETAPSADSQTAPTPEAAADNSKTQQAQPEKPQPSQSEEDQNQAETKESSEADPKTQDNTETQTSGESKTADDSKGENDTEQQASEPDKSAPSSEQDKPKQAAAASTPKQPEPKSQAAAKQAQSKPQAETPNSSTATKPKPGQAANTANKPKHSTTSDEKIKVSTARLDDLVNMVGELVIAQSMVMQETSASLSPEHELCNKVSHQGKIVRELQELSMMMRMVPIQGVFQKMARLVRDLSQKSGKKVDFVTEGEDTELDRIVVDQIADPLVHMIRNSVDHGIESAEERAAAGKPEKGTVHLRAFHQAGNIVIEIIDDGKGLDKDKILNKAIANGIVQQGQELSDQDIYKLIFSAGLSTAAKVTDVSGRGVGMDVVKKNIESLRGKIEISSTIGKGTTFAIKLPLTMAIIDGQVVRVGSQRYIIPIVSIECCVKPSENQISTVAGKGEMAMVHGQLIPMVRLYSLFGVKPDTEEAHESSLVVVEEDGKRGGLVVDELLGQHQVVIKSLGAALGRIKGVSGGAIMGDGKVNLILDIPGLLEASKE